MEELILLTQKQAQDQGVEVQSEVEKGTTFTIWLPVSQQNENKKG